VLVRDAHGRDQQEHDGTRKQYNIDGDAEPERTERTVERPRSGTCG
jgi:hypothetical protein